MKYGDTTVLDGLSWTMKSGENWVILGPNGCGKTTLLNLVSGDNPQAYANKVYLFGRRRGSGESIWDIKRRNRPRVIRISNSLSQTNNGL